MNRGAPVVHFEHRLARAQVWQERPELQDLKAWWTASQSGVVSLQGIGGAGKTAIVERFLRELPTVMPSHPEILKSEDLPAPRFVFVYSFYDSPNPDSFFSEVGRWLSDILQLGGDLPSYEHIRRLIERIVANDEAARSTVDFLFVVDGLEEVQDDGFRGGVFGQLLDGRLRDLFARLADGLFQRAAAIVTSRFPIADLEENAPPHFRSILVDKLPRSSAAALFRSRGVKDAEVDLLPLFDLCGYHALSLDLVAGYIGMFGGKGSSFELDIRTPDEIARIIRREPNSRKRALMRQEFRFRRIAENYASALKEKDPAALALLQRICIFRLGIHVNTILSIFTGPENAAVAGDELAACSENDVRSRIALLVEMHLIQNFVDEPREKYTVARLGTARVG